jgi:hypothetical protein
MGNQNIQGVGFKEQSNRPSGDNKIKGAIHNKIITTTKNNSV